MLNFVFEFCLFNYIRVLFGISNTGFLNMILWQLLPLCLLAVRAQVQPSKLPLYIGSMAPLSGTRAWWGAGITAAMQMAFEYINNSSHVLPSYELRLLANNTKVRLILIALLTFVTKADSAAGSDKI